MKLVRYLKLLFTFLVMISTVIIIYLLNTWLKKSSTRPTHSSDNHSEFFRFPYQAQVRLWIDIQNTFPPRECLQIDNHQLYTTSCQLKDYTQEMIIHPERRDKTRIRMKMKMESTKCIQADISMMTLYVGACLDVYWKWRVTGLLEYDNTGYCMGAVSSYGR